MLTKKNMAAPLLIALTFALVVLLNLLATWHQANTAWLYISPDHENIGIMYYKNANPDLFSTDYFFNDNRFFAYYTPSFLHFVNLTASITGDYVHGIALLQAPVLALYLAGAFMLFWQVSHSRALAVIFAPLSIIGVNALLDFWLVSSFYTMLPRTTALPGVVWSAFLLVRFLNSQTAGRLDGKAIWHWLLLGTLLGITANLHPPTGIAYALFVGIVALAGWKRNRRPTLAGLIVMILGTVLATAPIVLNIIGSSSQSQELAASDFQPFATAFEWRVTMLPRPMDRLAAFSNDEQFVVALLWLPVSLGLWLLARPNRRSWAALAFVAVQLAYAWLLIKNIDEYVDVLLIVVAAVLFLWRWWLKDEYQEMMFFEMIGAVTAVSFFLVLFLRIIWLEFEVWSLTTLVAELTRGARLFTLPFYLIGARFAFHLARRPPARDEIWLQLVAVLSILVPLSPWHVALLLALVFRQRLVSWQQSHPAYKAIWSGIVTSISAYIIYEIVTRVDATLWALIVGAVVALVVYVLSSLRLSIPRIRLVLLIGAGVVIGILTVLGVVSPINFTNDNPWYIYTLRGTPEFITFLLGGVGGFGLWLLLQPYLPKRWADATIWLCASLIAVMAVQSVGLFRYSIDQYDTIEVPALVGAALWAKSNTDQDALFFDTVADGSQFRFWSLRSVTHGWKELGLVGYSRPPDLVPMLERYQHIVAALENEVDMLAMADELGADFIIRDKDLPLDLPVAYENDELVIYQLPS